MLSRARLWLPALLVAAGLGYAAASSGPLRALAVASLVLGALAVLPVRHLPPLALLLVLLVPTEALPLPDRLQGAPLAMLPLLVWALRTRRGARHAVPAVTRACAGALVLWLCLSEALAPDRTNAGLLWWVTALAAVGVVATARGELDAARLRTVLLTVTSALGAFALVEAFVLHANPLYDRFYALADVPLLQHWSTYRATTTLGHPLVNGSVFAVAAILALDDLMARGRTRWGVVRALLLLGGIAATGSRTAFAAFALAAVVLILVRRGPRTSGVRRALLAVAGVGAVLVLAQGLVGRSESTEARASVAVRAALVERTQQAMEGRGVLGAGPGEAEATRRARHLTGSELPLESSYAQLAVGLGLGGLALFVATFGTLVVAGLRREETAGDAAAMLALLTSIGGYNALEGHLQLLVLLALLSAVVLARRTQAAPAAVKARAAMPMRTSGRTFAPDPA